MSLEKESLGEGKECIGTPCRLLAGLYLLLVYPFLHLYHYHSIIGNVPRLFDGIFGILAALVSAVLLVQLLRTLLVTRCDARGLVLLGVFFGFLLLAAAWIVIHYIFASGPRGSVEPFGYYSRAILAYLSLFLVGLFLNANDFRRLWLLLFGVIFVSLIFHINWDRLMIDLREVVDPSHSGAYLGLSTTAMFTALITWAVTKRPIFRLLVLFMGAVVLFFMGSRANLAGYVMVLPVAIALTVSLPKQVFLYAVGVVVGLVGLVGTGGMDWLMASRHGQFFALDQMTSLMARSQMMAEGLAGISASPIYGDYAGQLLMGGGGGIGSYIHNTLSVWQAFGLVPFVLFLGLLLWGVVFGLNVLLIKGRAASRHDQLLTVLAILVFILSITAKSVGWAHVALVWGLLAGRYLFDGRTTYKSAA